MKTMELKVARIGNSRGVRLPANTLRHYRINDVVIMEERPDGILLHPKASTDKKLSWADTAHAMAKEQEDWSEWDITTGDAIKALPWKFQHKVVAERRGSYGAKPRKRGKSKTSGAE